MNRTLATPTERWPAIITGVGGLLGLVLLGEVLVVITRSDPAPRAFSIGAVTSGLFIIGIIYCGYWLTTSEMPPEQYDRIGQWWIIGMVGTTLLIFPINATIRPVTAKMVVGTVRWSVAIGGVVGFVFGVFQARAIQGAIEAERARLRQQQTQRERDRLEQFASIVSHDLRAPLSVAEGHLRQVREDYDEPQLETIASAHDRMADIIEDTLILARSGQAVGETTPVDLADVATMSWGMIETKDATLYTDDTAPIDADADRLQHLFVNLFQNAIEHGGEAVTIRVGMLDESAGFYIEDDGDGIPPSDREQVFERGYSSRETGTGFGLNIVRTVVEAHDWEINLTESETGGARFEITGVTLSDR
ncbi:MAG: HAMP domain-containing sensor histidine kinase [Halobacteriales archaeon]|nr:HAMP domain-containing sensor histidine kinase [Halobacteriales archaeon]